jgi:hypothetical protein
VRCTTSEEQPLPGFCRWTTTITRDSTLDGGRRLVVANAISDDGLSRDYVFVFGCSGGRVRSVLHDWFDAGVAIQIAAGKILLSGSNRLYSPEHRRRTYVWSETLQSYTESGAGLRLRPRDRARCDDIATTTLNDLHLENPNGFQVDHGMGCYSEIPEIDPRNCGWMLTLEADRMIGPNRRLVVIGRDHRGGAGWDSDVFVLACISGRVATVFAETYDRGASVPQTSADAVIVAAGGWNPGDGACCLSREDRFDYEWDDDLSMYVLRKVESRSRAQRP